MDLMIHHYIGAKQIVKEDIIELIGKKEIISEDKFSIIKNIKEKEIAKLSFLLQSAIHIGILLCKGELSEELSESLNKISSKLDKKSLTPFLKTATNFAIRTVKDGSNPIPSPDISSEVGDWFSNEIDKELNVKLKNPELPILAIITHSEIIIALDVIGFSLNKRPYKIALHSGSINGVIAYTISRLAGVNKTSKVVDPFCGGGTIPIEVALYQQSISSFPFENKFAGFRIPILKSFFEKESEEILNRQASKKVSVFGFDNMLKIVKGAQKNAKLSGVFESITFSKVDIEWVDAKFDQDEVDIIITNPPQISIHTTNKKQLLKTYDDLFYQSKYLIGKKGMLAVLLINTNDAKEIAIKHNFEEVESIPIQSGGQKYSLVKFKVKQ